MVALKVSRKADERGVLREGGVSFGSDCFGSEVEFPSTL